MKKKALQRKIDHLNEELDRLEMDYQAIFTALRTSCDIWRGKYEEAVSSPEIKADTEAAFRRGAENMKRSCASFLYTQIQQLETPSES